jgi:hypothetical protein
MRPGVPRAAVVLGALALGAVAVGANAQDVRIEVKSTP